MQIKLNAMRMIFYLILIVTMLNTNKTQSQL